MHPTTKDFKNIKGAIFDVDGTILDTMAKWDTAAVDFLGSMGLEAEDGIVEDIFPLTMMETAVYLIENYNLSLSPEDVITKINCMMGEYYREEAEIKFQMFDLIKEFKKDGIPMAIATTTDKAAVMPALERLGLVEYFDIILTCSEVGKSKEHPDIFYKALEILKSPVKDTWVFEDGHFSAETASREGFKICGVYDHSGEEKWENLKELSQKYFDQNGLLW